MTGPTTNPYEAVDFEETGRGRQSLVKRWLIAFLALLVPLMIVPHSSGNSQRSKAGVVTDISYQNYGLPKWLTSTTTNGQTSRSVEPFGLLGLLFVSSCGGLCIVLFLSRRTGRGKTALE